MGAVVHNAEQVILGALMIDPAQADKLPAGFSTDSFRDQRHATIYRAIMATIDAGESPDYVAVAGRLMESSDLGRVGGVPYLQTCTTAVPISAAVSTYAAMVVDAAEVRRIEAASVALRRAAEIESPARRAAVVAEMAEGLLARPAGAVDRIGSLFGDVAGMLANGIPEAVAPTILSREDGVCLFYENKVNVLFGDPESGKTWVALGAVVAALGTGKRACILDLDHNGLAETISRLLALGAAPGVLSDRDRFLYTEPEDAEELALAIRFLREWTPAVAVIDSVGELLPMLGGSSNDNDDYTRANRQALTPLATAGAAVIAIDHLPKGEDKREFGAIGAAAKRRAVNGVMYRVVVHEQFAPGRGGSCNLRVEKDRPGGVRAHCPGDSRTQPAGRFVMRPDLDGALRWSVTAPVLEVARSSDADIAELDALNPPPRSQRDVRDRLSWGSDRAMAALKAWRDLRAGGE